MKLLNDTVARSPRDGDEIEVRCVQRALLGSGRVAVSAVASANAGPYARLFATREKEFTRRAPTVA